VRIRPRILAAFGVPTAVTLVTSVVLFGALTQSLDATDRVRHTEQVIADANELIKSAVDAETGERGFIITTAETFLAPFTRGNITFDRTAAELRALVSDSPPQVARVDQAIRLHQQWIDRAATPEIGATRTGDAETAARLVASGPGKPLVDQLRAVVGNLVETEQNLLHARIASSDSAAGAARTVVFAGFGLLVVLELTIGLRLSNGLSGSAQAVTRAAQQLAHGETTIRAEVRSRDEIGELAAAFNRMADRLSQTARTERETKEELRAAVRDYSEFAARVAGGDLTATVVAHGGQDLQDLSKNLNSMVRGLADISGQVREGVQRIRTSTSEILAAVSQHTASACQQSAAINETATTVDEVRVASEQTAHTARAVAEQAEGSVRVSDEGTRAAETITRAMEEIRERVEAIARDILTLSRQTQQIGEITATVNDLASQSNILALNASIEAAKAGEHGRGFAVVATEVRNLAEQSKAATAQVRKILGDIQTATTAAVLATEQGTRVVVEGLELSGRAGDGIRSLAETIREASHAAQQIAASAQQQSAGMDQIAHAMKDVNESVAQFVAAARHSEQAAEDLNELSSQLAALTERYRLSGEPHGSDQLRRHAGAADGVLLGRGQGASPGHEPAPAHAGARSGE
jgi:methyl-accepting chemotaxis protein